MWLGGERFLPGQWPSGDATKGRTSSDPCNLFTSGFGVGIEPS
jgi:hypothetical protein